MFGSAQVFGSARRLLIVAALIVTGALVLTAGALVLAAHRVHGTSMAPTLADGELIAANPLDHSPQRFDVVVISPSASSSGGSPSGQQLVKRIIGLPGDRIEISRDRVTRAPLLRVAPAGSPRWFEVRSTLYGSTWGTRIECCTPDGRTAARPAPATVPAASYFVLGDNPDASVDSRGFGWVTSASVRAVVAGRLWPPAGLPDPGCRLDPSSGR